MYLFGEKLARFSTVFARPSIRLQIKPKRSNPRVNSRAIAALCARGPPPKPPPSSLFSKPICRLYSNVFRGILSSCWISIDAHPTLLSFLSVCSVSSRLVCVKDYAMQWILVKNRTAPDFGISSGIYLERALIGF